MSDQQDEVLYEHHEPAPKGRGCLFWGCLITAILLLLLLVGVPLALYFTFKSYVNAYTAEEPIAIETVELPEEQMTELTTRFETFGEAVKAGETPADLELTAEEINALIGQNADMQGHAFVRITDGQIGGDISIPLDGVPGIGDRYLNATGDFEVTFEDGELTVILVDGEVNGSPIPQQMLDFLKGQNLVEKNYENPEFRKAIRKFESLEISGDRILLKAKQAGEVESAEEIELLETAPE